MAIASGPCPSCGAPVEFKAGASVALVCPHCQHVVLRTDQDLVNAGRVADVAHGDSALAHGDGGVFQGKSFVVRGRVVMQHPQGGTWEEYYAIFGGDAATWIEEAMGRWYVLQQVATPAPSLDGLAPGTSVDLGSYGSFVVDEVNEGTFLSAEGELPFSAAPGARRRFADLSAPDGARASLQQVEGASAVDVFVGVETTFEALGVHRRSGEAAVHTVGTAEVKCPNCGGPLPPRKDPKAERFVCPYCGVLAEAATLDIIARQDVSRAKPAIPLGSEGMLDATRFIVIGYVTRLTEIEGEPFGWEEYLLYNADRGYAWLVVDEGVWRFGVPVGGGEIDTAKFPGAVRHRDKTYRLRNTGPAEVTLVLGEFYWRVTIGEKVLAHDFEAGSQMVSREASGTEVNWTFSHVLPPSQIESSFGMKLTPSAATGVPAEEDTEGLGRSFLTIGRFALIFVVFVLIAKSSTSSCHADGDDGDGSFSASGRGAGGAGGMGGMGGK